MEEIGSRFLRYATILTASDEESGKTCPSTDCQFDLARLLQQELEAFGLEDVRLTERCYVYGSLPASPGMESEPAIGLIAHMDTVNCVPAAPLHPRRFRYEGGDIRLNENLVMREDEYENLKHVIGHNIITTDGTTCLGADDKAGVAEIMALIEYYTEHPEEKHCAIRVGFTPDEEIGCGADFFDVPGFKADFAYTVDGGDACEIEDETFNAAAARVAIKGFSIHPGSAKNKMLNALKVSMEFDALLPAWETPEHTEGREGFYHLNDLRGSIDSAEMHYIIRDHDRACFEARKERMRKTAAYLNAVHGEGTVALTLTDSYYNMAEILKDRPEIADRARDAIRRAGMTPRTSPVRGGTDGSRLTFMGLPCPNIGTGGRNCHGVFEFVSVTEMEKVLNVLRFLTGVQEKNGPSA